MGEAFWLRPFSCSRFENHIEGRLDRLADSREAGFAQNLREPCLARLRTETRADLLAERRRHANAGREGVIDAADRIKIILQPISCLRLPIDW